MTHTPGPWMIDPMSRRAAPEIVGNSRRIAMALYWMGSEDDQVHANARLIAAAPQLLEACKASHAYLVAKYGSISSPEGTLIGQLYAAIAAAEGAP